MSQVLAGDPASSKDDSAPQTNTYDQGLDKAFETIRSLGDHHLAEMGAAVEQIKEHPQARTYQITVKGRLDASWSDWFNDMAIMARDEDDGSAITTLTGRVADQSALRGILSKLWDLNLELVSVNRVEDSTHSGGTR